MIIEYTHKKQKGNDCFDWIKLKPLIGVLYTSPTN